MKIKTTYIPLFLILSSFIACQNEKNSLDEQIVPNHQETITSLSRSTQNNVLDSVYVNTEGALVFETATAYMSITDTLLQFTNKELDQWEKSIGFSSLRKKLNKIYDEAFEINDVEAFPYLITKYPKYIELNYGNIEPIIKAKFYHNILNLDGYFYIKNDKYEVIDGSHVKITLNATSKTKQSAESITILYSKQTEITKNTPSLAKASVYPPGVSSDYEATGKEGVTICRNGNLPYVYAPYSVENYLVTKYKITRNSVLKETNKKVRIWLVNYYLNIDMYSWNIHDGKWIYYIPKDYILQCKEINALLNQTSFSVGTLPVWPYEIKNASTAQLGAEKDGYHLSHSFTFRYDNNNSPIDWCTCTRPIGQELEFRELEKLSLKARIYPFAYGIAFGYKTTMPNLKY